MKKSTKLMNYINKRLSLFLFPENQVAPETSEKKGKIIMSMSYHQRINKIMEAATPLIEDEINKRVKDFMRTQSSDNNYIPDPKVQKVISKIITDKTDDLLTDIRNSFDTEIDQAQEIIEAELEIEICNDLFPDSDNEIDVPANKIDVPVNHQIVPDDVWDEWEEWESTNHDDTTDETLEEITCQGCGSLETELGENADDDSQITFDWDAIQIKK